MTSLKSALMAGLVGLAGACSDGEKTPGFGAPYTVEHRPRPVLEDAFLRLTVSAASCGSGPQLRLHQRLSGDTAFLWARNEGRPAPCDMLMTEEQRLLVPDEARSARRVVLLAPGGGKFALRP